MGTVPGISLIGIQKFKLFEEAALLPAGPGPILFFPNRRVLSSFVSKIRTRPGNVYLQTKENYICWKENAREKP